MEWIDYREKLGISFWDEKKASFFIAQLLNSLDDFFKDRIDSRDLYEIIDFDSSKAKTFTIILHTGEKDYGCFQFRIHWNRRKMYASYTFRGDAISERMC